MVSVPTILAALPSSTAVQLVPAITSVAAAVEYVVFLPLILQSLLPAAKIEADNLDVAIESALVRLLSIKMERLTSTR